MNTPTYDKLRAEYRRKERTHAFLRALGFGPGMDRHARTHSWFNGGASE